MATDWEAVKKGRLASPAASEGYREAAAAHQFGMRVRQRREECGMSQADLARAIGSSQPAIARLEAGGTQPTLRTMRALSVALGASWVITPEGVGVGVSGKSAGHTRARPA